MVGSTIIVKTEARQMAEIAGFVMLAIVASLGLFAIAGCTSRSDDTYKGVACVVEGRC